MSVYRDADLQTMQRQLAQLEGELAQQRAENERLRRLVREHVELRFDPRDGCLGCGGPVEPGRLFGGRGWLGWFPPPYRTRLGSPLDVEWLRRPRLFKGPDTAPVPATRCPACRRLYVSY